MIKMAVITAWVLLMAISSVLGSNHPTKAECTKKCGVPHISCEISNGGRTFSCTCKLNHHFKRGECQQIDWCEEETEQRNGVSPCGIHGCKSLNEAYECNCLDGYDKKGKMCTDNDECSQTPGLCGKHTCVNTVGSYRCECLPGYSMVDGQCVDVNECEIGHGPCTNSGLCLNNEGSYRCDCRGTGYEGKHCEVDVDECATGQHECVRGVCVNTPGSYTCNCEGTGYEGDTCDVAQLTCPEDVSQYYRKCYEFHDGPVTKPRAHYMCEREGATLAAPTSQEENAFLTGLIGADAWLNIDDKRTQQTTEGVWVNTDTQAELSWTHWALEKPYQGREWDCVYMEASDGEWRSDYCYEIRGYVCVSNATLVAEMPTLGRYRAPDEEGMNIGLIVGIVFGAVLLVVIIIVMLDRVVAKKGGDTSAPQLFDSDQHDVQPLSNGGSPPSNDVPSREKEHHPIAQRSASYV